LPIFQDLKGKDLLTVVKNFTKIFSVLQQLQLLQYSGGISKLRRKLDLVSPEVAPFHPPTTKTVL